MTNTKKTLGIAARITGFSTARATQGQNGMTFGIRSGFILIHFAIKRDGKMLDVVIGRGNIRDDTQSVRNQCR